MLVQKCDAELDVQAYLDELRDEWDTFPRLRQAG